MGTLNDKLDYLVDTKSSIKQAIENKDVVISSNTSFRNYADKIGEIVTLEEGTIDANATANDILRDKTAYVNGQKVTGNLFVNSGGFLATATETKTYLEEKYPSFNISDLTVYKNAIMMVKLSNSVLTELNIKPENIKKGVTIMGVTGTYEGDVPDEYEESYDILNEVNETQDGYTEPGGTDAEIEAIMDEILGNSAQKDYEDTFNILNNVDGNSDTFTDLGGTEQEVEQVLDNVLNGNQN